MFANADYQRPYNVYPRDVTAPGPDQKKGVAKAQRTSRPAPVQDERSPKDGEHSKEEHRGAQ